MGILIALLGSLTISAKNVDAPTQQDISISLNKTKEKNTASHYQGVSITREGLKSYLKDIFIYNGIADQIEIAEKIIQCESGWNIFADNGISYGLAQFTPATWHDFGEGDIMNPHTQIRTMAKMWKNPKLRNRWDCYRFGLYKKFYSPQPN